MIRNLLRLPHQAILNHKALNQPVSALSKLSWVSPCRSHWYRIFSTAMAAQKENRLSLEKSPYLLQHKENPVNWYPWNTEVLDQAKAENKMIFLSIGYSTCHWCHVMERESFNNQSIADILNENFICIKVDREERPDVDKIYMAFVQAFTGSGGWPMSVWLTPELTPIFGGTYFPPEDNPGRHIGFKSLLESISQKWQEDQENMKLNGQKILEAVAKSAVMEASSDTTISTAIVDECYENLKKSFIVNKGGFSLAPKFPQPVNLNFLFRVYASKPNTEEGKSALNMSLVTLSMMAKGGIHDHISQGFHRYSTDDKWHVPHFEKMLYDQAQLAISYLDAYQITKVVKYASVAEDIFKYVNRDLSHELGGFYSAEDADSYPTVNSKKKKEGAFCVWTKQELDELLSENVKDNVTLSDVFCYHFMVFGKGNVHPIVDQHGELTNQNVLMVSGSVAQTASKYGLSEDELEDALEICKSILHDERRKRPKPHRDTKMITAWNGMMISAFARGGQVLNDTGHIQRASKAAEFVYNNLYNKELGLLYRSCYPDEDHITLSPEPIFGFAEDYALIIRGLLDLYETTFDTRWLQWSEELQMKQDALFWDADCGGYFATNAEDKGLIMRLKEDQDGAEPSASSVSAMNLLRLSNFLDYTDWKEQALKLMNAFSSRLAKIPHALPEMVSALNYYLDTPKQIIIIGNESSPDCQELIKTVHAHFIPNRVLILVDPSLDNEYLNQKLEILKTLKMKDGKSTAYICKNYACSSPTNSNIELNKMLETS